MEIRQATMADQAAVIDLYNQAKAYFKNAGIDQWQGGNPSEASFKNDVLNQQCYVLVDNGEIIATCAIILKDEPDYFYIQDGKWLSHHSYGVIHRVAVSNKHKGKKIAHQLFSEATKLAACQNIYHLRIDTHEDNLSMQRCVLNYGFIYCGIIYLKDGATRLAYEYDMRKK